MSNIVTENESVFHFQPLCNFYQIRVKCICETFLERLLDCKGPGVSRKSYFRHGRRRKQRVSML